MWVYLLRLAQTQTRVPCVMVERQRRDENKRVYSLREKFISARLSNGVGVCLSIKTRSLVGQ